MAHFDGHRGSCPTADKTFLNKAGCMRAPNCAPVGYSSAMLTLNESTSRMYYELAGALVYQVRQ